MKSVQLFAWAALIGATQARGQFQGPTILSRPAGAVTRDIEAPAEFRVHAGVNGVFESNVLLPGTTPDSNGIGQDLYGAELSFGILGAKSYKHTLVGLSYEGSYRSYSQSSIYNGSDHLVALELHHEFNKKWKLSVRPTGGTMARSTGGVLASGLADQSSTYGLPGSEIFDNRVYFTQGSADLTFQATPRLSFNLGGDGFFVRRDSPSLVGVDGASARADVAYRFTKQQTVGVEYGFQHFTYDRAFGTYDAHMAALFYSHQINRRWQVNLRAGGYRIESLGLQTIALEPSVAAIVGTNTAVGIGYGVHYLPALDASIRRSVKHGDLTLLYSKKLNPGNGVLLLSRNESSSMNYSQSLTRKLNFGFSGGVDRLMGVSEIGAGFLSYTAGGGLNYQLWRYAYLTGRLDWREYDLINGKFGRNTFRALIGLQFTSADTPIRVR